MQVRSTDWTQTLNPVGTRRWLGRSEATSRPVGLRIGSSSISSWCQAWTVVLFLPSPVCARAGGGLHRSAVPPALLGSARAVCACWCAAATATVTVTVGLAILTSSAAPVTAGATSRCHESRVRPRSGPGPPRLAANHSAADSETPIASDRLASTISSRVDSDGSLSDGASSARWKAGPAAAVSPVSGPQAGAQNAARPVRVGAALSRFAGPSHFTACR